MIFSVNIGLDSRIQMHMTSVYHLFDLVGDIGGVLEVFLVCLMLFIAPFSKFSFEMEALKSLFLARTNDPNVFEDEKSFSNILLAKKLKIIPSNYRNTQVEEEIENHHIIGLKSLTTWMLFIVTKYSCFSYFFSSRRLSKLQRLHNKGVKQL